MLPTHTSAPRATPGEPTAKRVNQKIMTIMEHAQTRAVSERQGNKEREIERELRERYRD